jgi:ferric-dicitrate binding protein FerR (iron transport regulator)
MDRDALVNEILELASACHTGGATDDERARLERLLEDNDEARAIYLRVADDTVTLNDVRRPRNTEAAPVAVATPPGARSAPARRHGVWSLAAAAALAAVGAALWHVRPAAPPPENPGAPAPAATSAGAQRATFARIVSISDVQWAADAPVRREWERVGKSERLHIDAGNIEILYDNGIQFVVRGPANCEFISESQVLATAGKMVARVGPEATGFEIVTPHATVIDRGTSFGMTIDPDQQTDVVVYEGMVDLALPEAAQGGSRRLEAGEAIRVRRDGRVGRIASVDGDVFLPPPRFADSQSDSGRVIRAVTDNLKSGQTAKYYRVISRGFREDCQAYVDRQHQWNGLDERGVPPFLLHGDYVMTFNDDKVQHDLSIGVDLAQPARLYLLVDDRASPPPKWLTDSFVDTGWDIGIDEGFDDVPEVKTAVGPGRSIEWTFSIWMQEIHAPTTVILGSLQEAATSAAPRDVLRAMYGIVATPLASAPPETD